MVSGCSFLRITLQVVRLRGWHGVPPRVHSPTLPLTLWFARRLAPDLLRAGPARLLANPTSTGTLQHLAPQVRASAWLVHSRYHGHTRIYRRDVQTRVRSYSWPVTEHSFFQSLVLHFSTRLGMICLPRLLNLPTYDS